MNNSNSQPEEGEAEAVRVSFDGEGLRLDTGEDAEIICQQLAGKDVEILVLQGNTFNIEAAERVGMELSTQPSLREAHFKDLFTSRGREIVPEAMRHLLKGISDSGAKLTLLDLSDNAIGPIGAPSVIEFLESDSALSLERLYLHNCGLGPEGSTSIAATIPRLTNLREFICGRNRLENKGASNMSKALSELNTLEVLRLNQNGIMVEGIRHLVDIIEANIETMQDIDLSDNTIKEEGAEALSGPISRSKVLRNLRLDDALLLNEGFSIICDALSKSQALDNMLLASFEGNEIHGDKVVELIELTFRSCSDKFTLNLLENEFTHEQLHTLDSLNSQFTIHLDDIDEDSDYDDDDDNDSNDAEVSNEQKANDNDSNRNNRSFGEVDKLGILFEKLEI